MTAPGLRAVFDTNIYISAFQLPGGQADRAYRLAISGSFELCSSPPIITETAVKLREKFGWDAVMTQAAVRSIGRVATVIRAEKRLTVLADDPDNRVLECALDAGADLIVTGDRHLLKLKRFEGVQIVRLADFLRTMGPGPVSGGRR